MSERTGWLEKYNKGRVISMVEVKYHRVKIKKTPRKKKGQTSPASTGGYRDEALYYVLDKNTSYGDLNLTGNSVFAPKEIVELELFVSRHQATLRVLAKVSKTETFYELKRPLFRGTLHFAAVNKKDFENIRALEEKRQKEEAATRTLFQPNPPPDASKRNDGLKITFKRT